MVEVYHLSGAVWVLGGLAMCGLGLLIGLRGRADLHADYDGTADRAFVSRWVGLIAVLMGVLTAGHGLREMLFGWDYTSLSALLVALLVLSWLTRLVAKGWTPGDGLDGLQ